MKAFKGRIGVIIGSGLLSLVIFSCAAIHYLNINYRLPGPTDRLEGRKVSLAFEDQRAVKEIIKPGARSSFENFSGNISFSLAKGSDPGFKIGVFEVPSLFKEAFRRRLEALGMDVLPAGEGEDLGLVIILKEFSLDLQGRNWKVDMGYEARLMKKGDMLSKQSVSGQGERLKIIGRKQADVVMSELFTDLVNRLDVPRLFQQAGLL